MSKSLLLGFALSLLAVACDGPSPTRPATDASSTPLFNRPPADPTANIYISNDAANLFQGDGIAAFVEPPASPFAGLSRYANGECGVTSNFFTASGESGDVVLQTDGRDRTCSSAPRSTRFTFMLINADGSVTPDGTETLGTAINAHQLERAASSLGPALYIPVGGQALHGMHLADGSGQGKCAEVNGIGGVAFRPILNDNVTYVGADDLQVVRNAADTWTISSLPDETDPVTGQTIHHDKAYCRGNGKLYHMPVYLVIKSSRAVAP
jgi:hypothetical protein